MPFSMDFLKRSRNLGPSWVHLPTAPQLPEVATTLLWDLTAGVDTEAFRGSGWMGRGKKKGSPATPVRDAVKDAYLVGFYV